MSNFLPPCSPYEQIEGIVYIKRMLDKIRLQLAGRLSTDYIPNLGIKLDANCCHFLGVDYLSLTALVRAGATDEEVWAWIKDQGHPRSEEEILIWNAFMLKYGWRDQASEILQRRLHESGYEGRTDIQTMFDYIDLDEGRPLKF